MSTLLELLDVLCATVGWAASESAYKPVLVPIEVDPPLVEEPISFIYKERHQQSEQLEKRLPLVRVVRI